VSRTFLAKWRNAVRDSELLDASSKLIGYTLSTYMNAQGGAFPAKTTLAAKASVSPRTVDRAIARLETLSFLLVTHAIGYRRGGNSYQAVIPNSVTGADSNAPYTTANSVTDDAQYRNGDARKLLESKRKRATTALTAEVGKAQNCGVADSPTEAAERWFSATGWQLQEEDALDLLADRWGLTELESQRILRNGREVAA
jgi:hypothetical protein